MRTLNDTESTLLTCCAISKVADRSNLNRPEANDIHKICIGKRSAQRCPQLSLRKEGAADTECAFCATRCMHQNLPFLGQNQSLSMPTEEPPLCARQQHMGLVGMTHRLLQVLYRLSKVDLVPDTPVIFRLNLRWISLNRGESVFQIRTLDGTENRISNERIVVDNKRGKNERPGSRSAGVPDRTGSQY